MPTPPPISIITRTKNRENLLARAAQSLRAQSFQDFEWIVVNDGGDASNVEACLKQWPAGKTRRVISSKVSQGRGWAAAAGLDQAKGQYAMFHDDDDALAEEALLRLKSALDEDQSAVAVSCAYQTIDEDRLGRAKFSQGGGSDLPLGLVELAYRNQILTIGTLFRIEIAKAVGGINTDLDVLEDWDLWLRMAERGDILRLKDRLAFQYVRRGSGDAASSDLQLHRHAEVRIRNAYLRRDLQAGKQGLGFLMNVHHRQTLEELQYMLARLRTLRNRVFFWKR